MSTWRMIVASVWMVGPAFPRLALLILPWFALAMAAVFIFSLAGQPAWGWYVHDICQSVGAIALMLTAARHTLFQEPLPFATRTDRAFLILLTAAFLLLLTFQALLAAGLLVIVAVITIGFLGRFWMFAMAKALKVKPGPWTFQSFLQGSLGPLAVFVIFALIALVVTIPIWMMLSWFAADTGQDLPLPSDGGPVTIAGLATEAVSTILGFFVFAAVGFFFGFRIEAWQGVETAVAAQE